MPVDFKLNGSHLTSIRSLNITLQITGGSSRREPNAIEFAFTREVGNAPDADADLLTFTTLKGETDNAAIVPVAADVLLADDNGQALVGTWKLGKCFVETYSVTDLGGSIVESTRLRGNHVTYERGGDGLTTQTLKV